MEQGMNQGMKLGMKQCMKPALGYIRVSKEREDGVSPEQQREKIKLQAKLLNLEVIHIYEDLDLSGRSADRPQFQEMIQRVRQGGIATILVYKIDRLARNVHDFHRYMSVLDSHGCSLISISQNFDTGSPTGRLLRNILVDFAQFESEMIGERIKDSKVANARRGRWNGGNCPFGYKVVDKQLIPHETEALIVKEMFDLALKGKGALALCKWLNEQNIQPRRGTVYGSVWREHTVRHMLANRKYTGQMEHAGQIYEGCHDGIIDQVTFDAVQEITERRRHIPKRHRNSPHLLGGMLWCSHCNHHSIQSRYNGRNKVRRYVCYTKKLKGVDSCPTKNIDAEGLEAAVVDYVLNIGKDRIDMARKQAEHAFCVRTSAHRDNRLAIEAEVKKLERTMKRLFSDYYDEGIITREQFTSKNMELVNRHQVLSGQLASIDQAAADGGMITVNFDNLVDAFANLRSVWADLTEEEKRSALQSVIRRVIIYEECAEINFFDLFTAKIEAREIAPATLFF